MPSRSPQIIRLRKCEMEKGLPSMDNIAGGGRASAAAVPGRLLHLSEGSEIH